MAGDFFWLMVIKKKLKLAFFYFFRDDVVFNIIFE
jgi:hypothetical protein